MGLFRWVGDKGRRVGRLSVGLWHSFLSPLINAISYILVRELREQGLKLAKEIVLKYSLGDLKGSTKREQAFNEIKVELKKIGIGARDSAINLAIEMFVNELKG